MSDSGTDCAQDFPAQNTASAECTYKLDQVPARAPALQGSGAEQAGPNKGPADTGQLPTTADEERARLPILLWDLNGTILNKTDGRRRKQLIRVRPGAEHLARLAERCRLGIFSSATHRTVATARHMLEQAAGNVPLFEPGLILHRDHTSHTPHAAGKYWDTAKPLHRWFTRLDRVLLFDDDVHKSLESERGNLVTVPVWDKDKGCTVLHEAVKAIEEVLAKLGPDADIRHHSQAITDRLRTHADAARQAKASAAQGAAGASGTAQLETWDADDANAQEAPVLSKTQMKRQAKAAKRAAREAEATAAAKANAAVPGDVDAGAESARQQQMEQGASEQTGSNVKQQADRNGGSQGGAVLSRRARKRQKREQEQLKQLGASSALAAAGDGTGDAA